MALFAGIYFAGIVGYLKSKVYSKSPKTLEDHKANISEEHRNMSHIMFKTMFRNAHERALR